MGLLSSTVSITRYTVDGKIKEPILETVATGLKKHTITDIDDNVADKAVGWTSFENPFKPDFEGSTFVFGTLMLFSLRVDKKAIPAQIVKKYQTLEVARRIAETKRDHLSRNEKKLIKEAIINKLCLKVPATPNIYDIIWHYEASSLWFFTNLKTANEELETLFSKTFKINLIRLFPYTCAELAAELTSAEKNALNQLTPTSFRE